MAIRKNYLRDAISKMDLATVAKKKSKEINKKVSKPDDFESVARRLECDDDKARFEASLGKIAKAKPVAKAKS